MLTALLEKLKTHQGEIDQDQLCADLGISHETLQNLLDLLVRKGKITLADVTPESCSESGMCLSLGKNCPGPDACPLAMLAPRQMSITIGMSDNNQ